TALREVAEETGIDNLYILRKLPKTYHFFQSRNSWQIKKTHWYLMKAESIENTTPCLAEGITRVSWFSREDIQRLESESYRSVKALIDYGLDLL
ncbi:MAG: NUDIX domain-containing protein, partial [Bacteroidetes bacterium]|nr:NUDIX domain-containing protein [Bacteroidota bacterium]